MFRARVMHIITFVLLIAGLAVPVVQARSDSTPFTVYLPIIIEPAIVATGTVTMNGVPEAGAVIKMAVYGIGDGGMSYYTTTTDATGVYRFTGVTPQQVSDVVKYRVYYLNPASDSRNYNGRLYSWLCDMRTNIAGSEICDMEIADIRFISPAPDTKIPLPTTFRWKPRQIPADNYELDFVDLARPQYVCWTQKLGHANQYTLWSFTANLQCIGQALSPNTYYAWEILVYGNNGYGLSWSAWPFTTPALTVRPGQ